MGYTTEFEGEIDLDKPLTVAHMRYLEQFSETRRMKRDPLATFDLRDKVRSRVGLPVGDEGGFYVGGDESEGVLDINSPPKGQPGLWCQWVPNEEGTAIQWNGGEKFYDYVKWMEYIIQNFLKPWGYVANGEIKWRGEERSDIGVLVVKDNVVTAHKGVLEVEEEEEDSDDDGPDKYSREEVIESLDDIITYAKAALKNIKNGKGDAGNDLASLHAEVNALYYSVDEGMADLGG